MFARLIVVFVLFLPFLLLLDAGFSCCVLFFLLFVLLLLQLWRFAVVDGVAFVAVASYSFVAVFAALLLLLRVFSGRQPLKSESLPAFDFPKCFCRLFCCLCCCVVVVSICVVVCAICCYLCGWLFVFFLLLFFFFQFALFCFSVVCFAFAGTYWVVVC